MDKNNITLMESIPVRQFEWEEDRDTERIMIMRPKFSSKLGKKYLLPFFTGKYFKIRLDRLGTAVWENCDGHKTVAEIKQALDSSFDDLDGIDQRLTKFIMRLYREKFIILVQKKLPD